IVDDMITTAGTLCNAAELIKKKGAKKIWAAVTHGIFTEGALEKIIASPIEKILVTDTIPQRKEVSDCPKVEVISVAPLLAEAIERIHSGDSLSEKLFR
ncbi:ribose-phosphate diphosphokinase, partial [Candidatus Daviesbacteria bacterium]|nr:ribose-phosphate diphosphokinase [Candidatus Daviesbacteria bacterium]